MIRFNGLIMFVLITDGGWSLVDYETHLMLQVSRKHHKHFYNCVVLTVSVSPLINLKTTEAELHQRVENPPSAVTRRAELRPIHDWCVLLPRVHSHWSFLLNFLIIWPQTIKIMVVAIVMSLVGLWTRCSVRGLVRSYECCLATLEAK